MIVGITGKSGSGKSYLSKMLVNKLNFVHIDIDTISHEVLSFKETIRFIIKEFGNDFVENDIVDRKKLGAIVFKDKQKLQKLNSFCQIQIENILDDIIKNTNKSIILDYVLLTKLKQFKNCDIKILLDTDFDTRFSRVSLRDNITKEYFSSRDNSIEPYDVGIFDYVFNNVSDEDIKYLINQLRSKLKKD